MTPGMSAGEILQAEGHTSNGRCDKCWREAAFLYAMGNGPYESHNEAYYDVMERAQNEAAARAAAMTEPRK